jgi:hypothetical protein
MVSRKTCPVKIPAKVGFDLLEPGLVPEHEWRPVVGKAANGTPNIQWGMAARPRAGRRR